LKTRTILAVIAAFVFSIGLVSPALACQTPPAPNKISFSLTVYLVGYTPGVSSTVGNIVFSSKSAIQWIALDGTLVSNSKEILAITNTLTGKGNGLSEYVDTYTGSAIGNGIVTGTSITKTSTVDGSVGTAIIHGSGSSDKYSQIVETATASWQPTTIPFATLVLTVTGTFTVKQ